MPKPSITLEDRVEKLDDRLRRVEGWQIVLLVVMALTSPVGMKIFEVAEVFARGKK